MLYTRAMRVDDLTDFFGTKAKAARALGVTKGAVTNWKEFVPPSSIWRVEQATKGAIKADPSFYEKLAVKRQKARALAARKKKRTAKTRRAS